MRSHWKFALVFAATALSVQGALAATLDAKAWTGTWHLNAAKSKFGAAGAEKSETRTYDYAGGKLSMKSTSTDAKGKETIFSYSASLDGKSAPMTGNANADSISLTAVSGHQIKASSRLKGKPTVESTATVSADGKHLTLHRTYVAMKGKPSETLVFDR